MNLNPNVKIRLIGANCARALEPEMVIHCESDVSYSFRTILAWLNKHLKKENTGTSLIMVCIIRQNQIRLDPGPNLTNEIIGVLH